MVSESELIGRLREFLSCSDLNTTTTATVRRQLESDFGIDLSDRKAFIREQVDLFLQSQSSHHPPQQQHEDDQIHEAKLENESQESQDFDDEMQHNQQDEEEEEVEGYDDKVKRSRNGKDKKRSTSSGSEVKRKGGGGFCKLCNLSPQLQEFMGAPQMARTEVVKKLWVYIREKNLQDSSNRRNIICDEPLRALFGVNSINMFQMNKVLSKHIWPLDSDDVITVKSAPKEKKKKQEREEIEEDSDEPKRKEKRQKGGKSGFLAPIQLSDALTNFLGTGENALSRSDVIKRMWDYIKGNNLQDPSDKRQIICDAKLKELFDVDSFNGFTVTKLLAPHFIKAEQ